MSVRTLRTVLPPACLLTLSLWSQAQTNPYGCHYFRNGRPHPVATAADRNQIEETIARSDTFDILHYDIQLDVTDYGGSTIKGITTVDFRALQPDLTHIRFDLFELTVDSVVSPSGPLTFTYDGQFLRVALPTRYFRPLTSRTSRASPSTRWRRGRSTVGTSRQYYSTR